MVDAAVETAAEGAMFGGQLVAYSCRKAMLVIFPMTHMLLFPFVSTSTHPSDPYTIHGLPISARVSDSRIITQSPINTTAHPSDSRIKHIYMYA